MSLDISPAKAKLRQVSSTPKAPLGSVGHKLSVGLVRNDDIKCRMGRDGEV
jgi:hypothetical protein